MIGPRGRRELHLDPALPLGVGDDPLVPTRAHLASDERLLLFTDGLTEAPDRNGNFFNPEEHDDALLCDDVEVSLDRLLRRVMAHTCHVLHDDLTMLLLAGPGGREEQLSGRGRSAAERGQGAGVAVSSVTGRSSLSLPAQPSHPLLRRDA